MQTLTIRVDDNYLDQVLGFLKTIPKSKREILQQSSSQVPRKSDQPKDDFLVFLKNGPTISEQDAHAWEQNIMDGYKHWNIEAF